MTSTETITIAAYRAEVRRKAEEYRNAGYADLEEWNKTMVHLGLEPFTVKQIKISKRVDTVVTKTFDAPTGVDLQEWLASNRRGLISHYDLEGHVLQPEDSEVEVVDVTPAVEGEEPLPGADTEDLKVYKRLVRREALRLRAVFDWCDAGTNTALDELGLAGIAQVRVPVDVTVTRRVFILTEAADLEEAREMIEGGEMPDLQYRVGQEVGSRERLIDFALSDRDTHFRGDPDPTAFPSLGNSPSRAEAAGRCAAQDPGTGYVCTWEDAEHTGDHVAASYGEVIAVWPR